MLKDRVSLQNTLLSLESVLRIDYEERTLTKLLSKATNRLSDAYQRDFSSDTLYNIMSKSSLSSEGLEVLESRILEPLKELAFINSLTTYTKRSPVSLNIINYLGYARENLCTALKYLQDEVLYEKRGNIIEPLKNGVNNIEFCQEKRLFVIMLTLEGLGIFEGVNIIAQTLYIGGLEL